MPDLINDITWLNFALAWGLFALIGVPAIAAGIWATIASFKRGARNDRA